MRGRLRRFFDGKFGVFAPTVVCIIAYGAALAAAWLTVGAWAEGSPLGAALAATVASTFVIFLFATLFDNASVYDPYWSVAPPLFVAFWIWQAGEDAANARAWIVLALVSAWAARLTWNCMRRWPGMEHEDFRYRDLRDKSGRWFPLVNLTGIELFPTLLVFLASIPLWLVSQSPRPLGIVDLVAAVVVIGAIAIETLADWQLRRFLGSDRRPGEILTGGLWAWSQHPNYFGEISFWWGIWLFGYAADPSRVWTVAGPLAMTALFVFVSVPMMLARKRARHGDYDAQTHGIAVLVPRPRTTR